MLPMKKPEPINSGKPGGHIAINKEFTPMPYELLNSLSLHGVKVEKSETRFRLYDRLMFFPYVVHAKEDFYLQIIPNYWSKKYWSPYPVWNPRALEYVSRKNGLNVIFIYEKDLLSYGIDFVSRCIHEKIYKPYRDESLVKVIHDKKSNNLSIMYDNEIVGSASYSESKTSINIKENDWHCIISPRLWIEKVSKSLSESFSNAKVLRFFFHPEGIYNTDSFMYFSKKMSPSQMNVYIDERNKILRSFGWKAEITLSKSSKRELFDDNKKCEKPPIHYPVYEPRQRKVKEGKKVKDNPFLMSKLSPNNPSEVFNLPSNSQKYALFSCDKGHEYENMIRGQEKYGCPVCSGNTVIPGVNDLATTDPEYAKNWDYEGSFPYRPEDVSRQSDRLMSWICPISGGKWERTVNGYVSSKGRSPYTNNLKIHAGYNDIATRFPGLVSLYSDENKIKLEEITSPGYPESLIWECPQCNGKWRRKLLSMINVQKCLVCSKKYKSSSLGEREIYSYVLSNLEKEYEIFANDRNLIGKELDIYIPEKKIAIEFNGLYWHSESQNKNKNYHKEKWEKCKNFEVNLITIWEDEWINNNQAVRNELSILLEFPSIDREDSSTCNIVPLDEKSAYDFLKNNSSEGEMSSDIYLGLINQKGKLISVSGWEVKNNEIVLKIHASNCVLHGGLKKMVDFMTSYAKMKCLSKISFLDNREMTNVKELEKAGFLKETNFPPEYYYVNSMKGKKSMKRMKKSLSNNIFLDDPSLIYQPGLTERELAELNGLERIWDCGKTRWVINI